MSVRFIRLEVIAALLFLLLSVGGLRAAEWRGITPLKSSRADVERLLGQPNKLGRYEFENERAYVHYARGSSCQQTDDCWCSAPADTVLYIYVEMEVEVKLSALSLDKSKYKKYTSPQDPAIATYTNDDEGITYHVNQEDGTVTAIDYLPASRDCETLVRQRAKSKE
ncbi:MAG TPA: hypothetical protein VGX92_06915 [Pyrinomonadaceae bacterium]|jgi:hypothetical protein|nr:hypothetical protein [Pyrinomonadaceae bacterium]